MEARSDVHNLPAAKDHQLASLLGLEVTEYKKLSHTGFRTVTGLDGKPMHFYTVISPLNPKPILERLKPKMNKTNTIYIPAEAIKIKDLPEDMTA